MADAVWATVEKFGLHGRVRAVIAHAILNSLIIAALDYCLCHG
jgi:hypothetical protein